MKIINPTEIDFLTEGERYTLDSKLKKLLNDEDCYIYIQPTINSLRPDFILIGKRFGVLIIEVKDWDDDFIVSTNKLLVTCKTTNYKNPISQINAYEGIISNKLSDIAEFITDTGELRVNIRKSVFYKNLSMDFLNKNQDLKCDSVGCFDQKSLRTLSLDELVKFNDYCLSDSDMLAIRSALFPEIVIPNAKSRNGDFISVKEIKALDSEQEEFAKKVPNGHYMVSGIPGSGKTVILLSRALHLAQQNDEHHILIVTYTKALANKLNNQLSAKVSEMYLPDDIKRRIDIKHFHGLCKELIGFDQKRCIEYGEDYFNNTWPQDAINSLKGKEGVYDSVLVDEYQDFHVNWFELCKMICKKNEANQENLFFAGDRLQRIYNVTWSSYKEIGINIQGRSKLLKTPYRTNQNHLDFALRFLSNDGVLAKDINNFYELGKLDEFSCDDERLSLIEGGASSIARYVNELVNNKGISPNEILILCHTNYDCKEMLSCLPIDIACGFKNGKEPDNDKGLITTYHSSKGLEAKYCILYKVEKFEVNRTNRILMYVGMTRASEKLIINYNYSSNFVSEILDLVS